MAGNRTKKSIKNRSSFRKAQKKRVRRRHNKAARRAPRTR